MHMEQKGTAACTWSRLCFCLLCVLALPSASYPRESRATGSYAEELSGGNLTCSEDGPVWTQLPLGQSDKPKLSQGDPTRALGCCLCSPRVPTQRPASALGYGHVSVVSFRKPWSLLLSSSSRVSWLGAGACWRWMCFFKGTQLWVRALGEEMDRCQ